MRFRLRTCVALVFLAWLMPALGAAQMVQAPPPPPPPAPQITGYPVLGRVLCADTQRPARFAQVMLVPASTGVSDYDRGRAAVGRTDLDGHFTIDNVPAGDYYATAEMIGYINDAASVRIALSQGGDALNTITGVPRVEVTAGGASVQISLQRGATIAGAVQWDDGSPAAGVQVGVGNATSSGAQSLPSGQLGSGAGFGRGAPLPSFGTGGQTDDRGRFRLSGLPPGSYVLRATLQSPVPVTPGQDSGRFPRLMSLNVYAPNKLRKTDATVMTLVAGEERPDVNIVLGLGGMHTVSGQVSSSTAAVRSGSVVLTDQADSTLNRRANIAADGSFSVPYVPAGTYTLRVSASSQQQGPGHGSGSNSSSETATRFQPAEESITVADSDLSGVNVTVTAASTSP